MIFLNAFHRHIHWYTHHHIHRYTKTGAPYGGFGDTIVIGLLSFVLAIVLTIAYAPVTSAQSPSLIGPPAPHQTIGAGVERLGDIEVAPIRLDGQVLFKVASPTVWDRDKPGNSISVEARAKQIEASLNRILGNYKIHLPLLPESEIDTAYDPETLNVYVAKLNNETTIFVKDNAHPLPFPLLTVTQADAEYAGIPIEETAIAIQSKIEHGLRQALQDRSPTHLGLQTFKAALIVLGTLSGSFILWGFSKLLHKRDEFLKARQASKAKESSPASDKTLDRTDPAFRRLSVLHEWRHQSALERRRSLIIVLIWLVNRGQIILWLGGVLLVLSLFPWTKPLFLAILSLPVKLLGIWLVVGLINLLINTVLNLLEKFWNHHIFTSEDEQRRSLRIATTINALKDIKMTIIYLIALIWAISILGVPTGSILAISGLIVVALSLSIQNVVKDIVTGCLILWEDQFAVGDTIAIQNTSGSLASGLVENMNLRITQLRNLEGRLITIPNSTITQVQNMTRGWSQVDFSIEISSELDIDQEIAVIQEAAQLMYEEQDWRDLIIAAPDVLGVDGISQTVPQTTLLVRVLIRTKPGQQWRVQREFYRRVLAALSKHHKHHSCQTNSPQLDEKCLPNSDAAHDITHFQSSIGFRNC